MKGEGREGGGILDVIFQILDVEFGGEFGEARDVSNQDRRISLTGPRLVKIVRKTIETIQRAMGIESGVVRKKMTGDKGRF